MPACKNCRKSVFYLRRQLCKTCYYQPAIKRRFPIASVQIRKNGQVVKHNYNSETNRVPPKPPVPTTARPGSEEKIRTMQARAARGEQIFHHDDLTTVVSTSEWAHGTNCL